jgi:hypothetical protein
VRESERGFEEPENCGTVVRRGGSGIEGNFFNVS